MKSEPSSRADARGLRVAIVVSRYHDEITSALRDGAVRTFTAAGGLEHDMLVVPSPGAFELVALCSAIVRDDAFDAVVALGCIITGETTHDQYIAAAVASGLADIAGRSATPVAFGVLTCQSIDQARARAGGAVGNKGEEAMHAAIETAVTIRSLTNEASI